MARKKNLERFADAMDFINLSTASEKEQKEAQIISDIYRDAAKGDFKLGVKKGIFSPEDEE